jgi:deoxycytidine triphosphate deaminase
MDSLSLGIMQIHPRIVIERRIIFNLQNETKQIQQVGIDLTIKEDILLKPKEFKNVEVNEMFDMRDCFGLIVVRSSYSRIGVFVTSGVYDPGFKGVGGVSIYNLSDTNVIIQKGTRICQMVVFEANGETYNGHYNSNNSIKSKEEQ